MNNVWVVGAALVGLSAAWPPETRWRPAVAGVGGLVIVAALWDGDLSRWSTNARTMLAAATVALVATATVNRPRPHVLGWLPVGASVLTAYLCVPETDHVVQLGLVVCCLAGAELITGRSVGPVAHSLVTAVAVWAALVGAVGRSSAVIVALGACAAAPLVGHVAVSRRQASIGAVWIVAGIVAARTGGIGTTRQAWIAVAAALVPAAAISVVCGGRWRQTSSPRRAPR